MDIDRMTTAQVLDVLETERLNSRQLVAVLDLLTQRANTGDENALRYFEAAEHAATTWSN